MIFSDGEWFDEKGQVKSTSRPTTFPLPYPGEENFWYDIHKTALNDGALIKGDFYHSFCTANYVFNSSAIIRKEILSSIGELDEKIFVNSDYDLWLRISQKHPVVYLNTITGKYRIHEDSLSGATNLRAFNYSRWDGSLFEKHLAICQPPARPLIRKRICDCYQLAAWGYFHHGDMKETRRLCFKSLEYKITQPKLYLYVLLSFLPLDMLDKLRVLKTNLRKHKEVKI
jgi:hypothetical protein